MSLGDAGGGSEGVGTTETPHLDDIPNMEEDDLEEGDDEATAAAPEVLVIPAAGVVDAGYVLRLLETKRSADDFFVVPMWKLQREICFKSTHTM